jgi:hypothetical protein
MNRPSNSRALRLRTILPTNHIAIVWDGAGRVKTPTSCDSNKMWTSRDEPGRYLNRLPIRARLLARLPRNARAPASAGAPLRQKRSLHVVFDPVFKQIGDLLVI